MCPQTVTDDVTVCDVALPAVAAGQGDLPDGTCTHLEGAGTRIVTAGPSAFEAFRSRLAAAIAQHGGSPPAGPQ